MSIEAEGVSQRICFLREARKQLIFGARGGGDGPPRKGGCGACLETSEKRDGYRYLSDRFGDPKFVGYWSLLLLTRIQNGWS